MHPLAEHLPATRVELTSGPVSLRIPDEHDLAILASAVRNGGLDDDQSRASLQWQPATPELAAQQTIAHITSAATAASSPEWLLPFVVFVNSEPIGRQDMHTAGDFTKYRILSTGSYLLNTHRRMGHGTHARACILALAWELGADLVTSGWHADNTASARVSTKLGHVTNGVSWWWDDRHSKRIEETRASVTRDQFLASWAQPVLVTGVDADVRKWLHCPSA